MQPQQPTQWGMSSQVVRNPFPAWAHLMHATLTALTCGVWGIVWAIHYGSHKKFKTVVTYHQYHQG